MAKTRAAAKGGATSTAYLELQQQNQELMLKLGEALSAIQVLLVRTESLETKVEQQQQRIGALEAAQRASAAVTARLPVLMYGPANNADFVRSGWAFAAGCSPGEVCVTQFNFLTNSAAARQRGGTYAQVARAARAGYLVTFPAKQQQQNALGGGKRLHESVFRPLRVDYFCTKEQMEVRSSKQALRKQLQAQGRVVRWVWAQLQMEQRDGT